MRDPECFLIRVGELALKSEPVQKRFFRVLVNNIRNSIKNIEMKTANNRIFIYGKKNILKQLKMVFGVTSISPVWICDANMKDIRKLSAEVGVKILKIKKKDSFAVRARRTGNHSFTSQDIGREAGDAINIRTKAGIDLTNPDKEVFIECRHKRCYIYVEKEKGPGGLPLGVSGKALAIVNDRDSALAAWLIMKRGVRISVFSTRKNKFLKKLEKWHKGKKMKIYKRSFEKVLRKERVRALVIGEGKNDNFLRKIDEKEILVLRPLVGLNAKERVEYAKKAGI